MDQSFCWSLTVFLLFIGGCSGVPRPVVVAPEHAEIVDHLVSLNANVVTRADGKITEVSFFYDHEAKNPSVSDADIACLADLSTLERLCLAPTEVTDDGLASIAALQNLQSLWLPPSITDSGFVHLRDLINLRTLIADETRRAAAHLNMVFTLGLRHTAVVCSSLPLVVESLVVQA